jgi:hypothetical protein
VPQQASATVRASGTQKIAWHASFDDGIWLSITHEDAGLDISNTARNELVFTFQNMDLARRIQKLLSSPHKGEEWFSCGSVLGTGVVNPETQWMMWCENDQPKKEKVKQALEKAATVQIGENIPCCNAFGLNSWQRFQVHFFDEK